MSRLYKAQTRYLFHAHIKIKLSIFYPDTIFDELFDELARIDRMYNSYQKDSYIDLINKNAGSYVEVDDETIQILTFVRKISDLFDGQYDITIMPLLRLWGFYKENNRCIPTESEIDKTKSLIDYRKIEINGHRVKIEQNQEIITGSFIKAYAVDRVIQLLHKMDINDAIINAGGSTIMACNDESHQYWQANVREPHRDELLFTINLNNNCLSTSSQSKTFIEMNGVRYGHILNAKTGMPSNCCQVGIISDNCMFGDIVSTALFNLTSSEFSIKMEQLSQLYNIEGYMIDKNGDIIYSDGFEKFINH